MVITSYPAGLHAKTDFFRVLDSMFDNDMKEFILSRMKGSDKNIKPVIVVNDSSKVASCFFPNATLTQLIPQPSDNSNLIIRRKVESTSEWFVRRTLIQRSNNLTITEKEDSITLLVENLLKKRPMNQQARDRLANIEGRI